MDMELFHQIAIIAGGLLTAYYWINIIAILLTWINADPYNQIVHLINRLVLPFWDKIGKITPRSLSAFAAYLALLAIMFLQNVIPGWIRTIGAYLLDRIGEGDAGLNLLLFVGYGGSIVLYQLVWFVFILSVVWFILTIVSPPLNNPIVRSLMLLLDPLLTPLQRVLPRARVDLSPIILAVIAFIGSNFLQNIASILRQNILPV